MQLTSNTLQFAQGGWHVGRYTICVLDRQVILPVIDFGVTVYSGGPTSAGASNYPLRGGKGTLWEVAKRYYELC